jgi:nicotinamide phosphoribosyltransferase
MYDGVTGNEAGQMARAGAEFPTTVNIGLQQFLDMYMDVADILITQERIDRAKRLAKYHLGSEENLNIIMWDAIKNDYAGIPPVKISAVPEGTEVPTGCMNQKVELSEVALGDERVVGIVSHIETILTNTFTSNMTATKSKYFKRLLVKAANRSCETYDSVLFALQDFGMRSAKTPEVAGWAGTGHLGSFFGTDTVPAWEDVEFHYDGNPETIGYSVFATEHNMKMYKGPGNFTAEGVPTGEYEIIQDIINKRPKDSIISDVSDTFNIYETVKVLGSYFKPQLVARAEEGGVWVVRPDSVTPEHPTPGHMTLWILEQLWSDFGGEVNKKGYRVLNPAVRVIFGDSLDLESGDELLNIIMDAGFASENVVLGCGSWLSDKHNRDTNRNAYKSFAMIINGLWTGVGKNPVGTNFKKSPKGRQKLTGTCTEDFKMMNQYQEGFEEAVCFLKPVWDWGVFVNRYDWDQVRENNDFDPQVMADKMGLPAM